MLYEDPKYLAAIGKRRFCTTRTISSNALRPLRCWSRLAPCARGCVGIAFWLTRILSQLGRDPGFLVRATQKVMAGNFKINDNGPKIGVYRAFVDMVKNLEDNDEAKRQTEMTRMESEKALWRPCKKPKKPKRPLNGPKERVCGMRPSSWKALWRFCLRPRNSFPPRLNSRARRGRTGQPCF